jgi:hypothetical protein
MLCLTITHQSHSTQHQHITFQHHAGACEVVTHEVSPGVFLSMQALPTGGHELRRVRFAKQMFSSDDAEQWWAANRSAVYANYNIVGLPHQQQQHGTVALAGQNNQLTQQALPAAASPPLLARTASSNGSPFVVDQQPNQQQQGVAGGRVSAAAAALTTGSGGSSSSPPPVVSVMNPHPLGPPAAATSRAGSLSEVRTKR